MRTNNLTEALRYHAEHPGSSLVLYDEYGNREYFSVENGELVYAETPFPDLNGNAVQAQDLASLNARLARGGWVEVTHREAPTRDFPFFEEI